MGCVDRTVASGSTSSGHFYPHVNSYCVSLPDVESNIGVWLARRTFYVYHARVFGDELGALEINAMGGLTVSFNKYGSIADAWNIAVFAASDHKSHDAD